MDIQFGRDICGSLATAEAREWLVTNGIGGYACGTIAGVLTRHYHGLLIAALHPPLDRTLLATKLNETVYYRQRAYVLNTDRWADGSVTGHGYRWLEQFAWVEGVPTWRYACADALIEKRICMAIGANTTYVQYRLIRASQPITLKLKVFTNYRSHHHHTQNPAWPLQVNRIDQGVVVTTFPDAVPLYLRSAEAAVIPARTWYRQYGLAVEAKRGIPAVDDHCHTATVQGDLWIGETLTVVASTEAQAHLAGDVAIQAVQQRSRQLVNRWHAAPYLTSHATPAWIAQLVQAADQFIVERSRPDLPHGKTIIAGYPWFGDWGRDTMISLPGLAIATGRLDVARPILETFARYLDQGMLPNVFPEAGETPYYNTVDAILWYFEAIRAYYAATHDQDFIRTLFPALAEVIHWHQRGTRYHIHVDQDGLLYAGQVGDQITWMDAKVGDWVVTPRIGKPVEVNALWYNALVIMTQFAAIAQVDPAPYQQLADQARQGFQRFWNPAAGYCYDVLDSPTGDDPSLRPNQIFAVALPQVTTAAAAKPLLSPRQQRAVVDTVAQHLLTSHGLRSLAPDHKDYHGTYGGTPLERDGAYHQGTVWGWLIGPFVQAHWQVYQDAAIARSFLTPMANHLRSGCVGTLSEIFDGDSPMTPRGAFAQAWTVAEVLRTWMWLSDRDRTP